MQRTLLIGLGNPGEDYAGTYHNVGWELLDFLKGKLEKRYGAAQANEGKKFHFYQYGEYCLIYPDTYMNLSGQAVRSALEWFHKTPEEAAIFHDDSDLALGECKEASGGAAGHHGIESVLEIMGNAPLLRIRIGIRHPKEKSGDQPRRKAGEFVLKRISKEDKKALEKLFDELSEKFIGSA